MVPRYRPYYFGAPTDGSGPKHGPRWYSMAFPETRRTLPCQPFLLVDNYQDGRSPQCFIPKYFPSKSLAIQTIYEHSQKLLMQSELIYWGLLRCIRSVASYVAAIGSMPAIVSHFHMCFPSPTYFTSVRSTGSGWLTSGLFQQSWPFIIDSCLVLWWNQMVIGLA